MVDWAYEEMLLDEKIEGVYTEGYSDGAVEGMKAKQIEIDELTLQVSRLQAERRELLDTIIELKRRLNIILGE